MGPLAFGEQKVGVEAPGYAGVLQTVAESDTSLVVRLKAGGEFTGRVTFADGSPAAGVPVTVHGAYGFAPPGTTGADGTFVLRSVPVGSFTLRAHTLKDGTLVEATTRIDDGTGGVVLRLGAHGGQERGGPRLVTRVLDPQGRPVPQAQAVLRTPNGASQQSVRDGRVEWTQAIPAGSGAVVEIWGARDARGAFLPLGPGTATVPDGATEVEVRLAPEVTVTGTVRASEGTPVRGVLVRAQPVVAEDARRGGGHGGDRWHRDAPQARTDDAGAFRLGGLAAAEYDLTVVAPRIYAPLKPLRVSGGDRDVDVRLKVGLTVSVTVRDEAGKPVSGVSVFGRPKLRNETVWMRSGFEGDGGATTGADGVVRLNGLDADVVHTLQVTAKGEDLGSVTIDPWTPATTAIRRVDRWPTRTSCARKALAAGPVPARTRRAASG